MRNRNYLRLCLCFEWLTSLQSVLGMQLIALISPSKPLRPHIPLFIIPSDRLIVKFFVSTVKPIYECPILANLGMPSMELFYSGIDINNFSITIRTPLLIMIIYLNGFMRQSIVLTFINTHYQLCQFSFLGLLLFWILSYCLLLKSSSGLRHGRLSSNPWQR